MPATDIHLHTLIPVNGERVILFTHINVTEILFLAFEGEPTVSSYDG